MFGLSRGTLLTGVAAVVSALALGVLVWRAWPPHTPVTPESTTASPATSSPAPATAAVPAKAAAPAKTAANIAAKPAANSLAPAKTDTDEPAAGSPPAFDVVRVEPSGETVVAGRAKPGSTVALMVSGKPAGTAKADANGQFVIIPDALKPGAHDLALTQQDGGAPQPSKQNVAVSVPGPGSKELIVALIEPGKPARILSDAKPAPVVATPAAQSADSAKTPVKAPPAQQAGLPKTQNPQIQNPQIQNPQIQNPQIQNPQTPAPQEQTGVSIRTVEAEPDGAFYATGRAAPGAKLRVYLNDARLADVIANATGEWTLRVARGMTAGDYKVRADVIAPASGKVASRVEVPFAFPAAGAAPAKTVLAAPPVQTAAATTSNTDTPGSDRAPTPATAPAPASAKAPAVTTAPATAPALAPPPATPTPPPAAAAATPEPDLSNITIERVATAAVERGDSLWRISRKMLGRGVRYTQIYQANTAQIRNPALIYPGQLLVVPMDGK